ncbi:HpcH/HpaI aldolase family protein [Roseibium salinum]|uniref:Aldolase/citrate lyase family protein n=1 Tax=Roseibium salinum TaxID=1604349 RepID=A0ABT3QZ09_9HYPH|nr:aldolase/citrate lyase family protein [Roseibium sp. DSM 29163]MCX2722140.1 aldolase/citrate lyase family protein [Roseibium sp. DSM 29163]MDN3719847.1 aldolase/citrate lyase family protein [Roseibium salinum]
MTDISSLADKMRSGRPVITGWSVLNMPMIVELFARGGYQAVAIDLQHGLYGFDDACDALASIAAGGAHRIARIPIGDNALAGRLADMGAECLIAPMINTRGQAEEFARAVKYPPAGERSWSPFRAAELSGQTIEDYTAKSNFQTLSLAMIETAEAIDALDEILSVPELDGVFVGPSDLSLSLSGGAAVDPNSKQVARVAASIADKARKAGKLAGIFCMSAEKVQEAADHGYCLMAHGIDRSFLVDCVDAALKEVEGVVSRGAS